MGRFVLDGERGPEIGPVSRGQAFASNAADSLTLGFGDEIAGAADAANAAIYHTGDPGEAYRKRVQLARARIRAAREQHPVTSFAGSIAGAAAPVGLAFRGAKVAGEGLRGFRALRAEAAAGAKSGAIFGGAYGFGGGDGDLGQRAISAAEGGAGGAILGGPGAVLTRPLFSIAGKLAAPIVRPVRNAISEALIAPDARAMGNQVGMFRMTPGRSAQPPAVGGEVGGGGGGVGGAGALPEPEIPDSVVRGVDRLMGREGQNVGQLENTISEARATPAGRVLADTQGRSGRVKTAALAQTPGTTGRRAEEVANDRAAKTPRRLVNELMAGMKVNKSPTQALRSLAEQYKEASAHGYAPVLDQDVAPEALARLEPIRARYPERLKEAVAQTMDDIARLEGKSVSTMTAAQRVHLEKMALDDAIGELERKEGFGAATRGAMRQLKRDFLGVVEGDEAKGIAPVLKGYREQRERWGSLKDAEEAVAEGGKGLSLRPEEMRARMDEMTAFERAHYRVGLADALAKKIMSRGKAVGGANSAEAINTQEIQDVLREAFDSPEQAAHFLDHVNESNQLMRNAQRWTGGSDTVEKAAAAADEGLAGVVDKGFEFAKAPVSGAQNAAQAGIRALVGGHMERARNELGRALLTAIDDGDQQSEAYLRALIKKLRARETERNDRVRNSAIAGATDAIGGGSYTDDTYQ